MNYQDYEKAFSQARLNKYLAACGQNVNKALTLYRHNVKLCQKFYGMLNIFEVVLRNAIDSHYRTYFNDKDWIFDQLQTGGILEFSPMRTTMEAEINKLSAAGKYTPDKVVAGVTFGFWTYLFNKVPFRKGGQSILHVFPRRSKGIGQKAIFKELQQIRQFRNRIAHHEPICFDAAGNISMVMTKNNYALIQKYISFLGYKETELFFGFDVLPDTTIQKIQTL